LNESEQGPSEGQQNPPVPAPECDCLDVYRAAFQGDGLPEGEGAQALAQQRAAGDGSMPWCELVVWAAATLLRVPLSGDAHRRICQAGADVWRAVTMGAEEPRARQQWAEWPLIGRRATD
jgi:hypothetical protein